MRKLKKSFLIIGLLIFLTSCSTQDFYFTEKMLVYKDHRSLKVQKVDDWIYYDVKWKLYKIKSDGTGYMKLIDEPVWEFKVVGDWIYYLTPGNYDWNLYRIKTDGTHRTRLTNHRTLANFKIINGWIYYINSENQMMNLYKMRLDGQEKKRIISDEVSTFKIKKESIFYTSYDHIYRTDLNGKEVTKFDNFFKQPDPPGVIVTDGKENILPSSPNKPEEKFHVTFIQEIQGDWIYYRFKEQIMKIKIDGTEKTIIGDAESVQTNNHFVIDGDWIYYSNFKDRSMYKIKTDGTENTRLNSYLSDIIIIDDGWIYYYNYSYYSNKDGIIRIPLYKIRINGSDEQRMDKSWTLLKSEV